MFGCDTSVKDIGFDGLMTLDTCPSAYWLVTLTVILTVFDVLVAYVDEPPYTAISEDVPVVENEVVNVATPELSVPVPREVDP